MVAIPTGCEKTIAETQAKCFDKAAEEAESRPNAKPGIQQVKLIHKKLETELFGALWSRGSLKWLNDKQENDLGANLSEFKLSKTIHSDVQEDELYFLMVEMTLITFDMSKTDRAILLLGNKYFQCPSLFYKHDA
uniref:Uncharacterized protein n=1 Tax=Romanomermis culicivorax TaxID=13658 RepID=A0A915JB00_ROMCU